MATKAATAYIEKGISVSVEWCEGSSPGSQLISRSWAGLGSSGKVHFSTGCAGKELYMKSSIYDHNMLNNVVGRGKLWLKFQKDYLIVTY